MADQAPILDYLAAVGKAYEEFTTNAAAEKICSIIEAAKGFQKELWKGGTVLPAGTKHYGIAF